MEKLAYIEGHRISGIWSNRTCGFTTLWHNLKHMSLSTFSRSAYVLVNKSAFVNGHLYCSIFWKITSKKASRIIQYQFRTKIKSAFATWMHILIELQNSVLIYRAGRIVSLNLPTSTKVSCFDIMAPYIHMVATLHKWRMN